MKARFALALVALLAVSAGVSPARACVGKTLTVGVLAGSEDELFAELIAVLVNERTGTTVTVNAYATRASLYDVVARGEVGILVETTERALERLGETSESDSGQALLRSREGYRKAYDLVWLEPFGSFGTGPGRAQYAPVITSYVMSNFPALPRVINKLGGIVSEAAFARMLAAVKSGDKPKSVARDFLKERRLI